MQTVPARNLLANLVVDTRDIQSLVPPMLEILEAISGMESTYLTAIDADNGVQTILFSHNTGKLDIPAGLAVPWDDTLCKRAIDENRFHTDNVQECWGNSLAARRLGIRSYVSAPVRTEDDELFGTLCGASAGPVDLTPETQKLFGMFARLIARQIENDREIATLREERAAYLSHSLSDPLTGLPNRRALRQELARSLANADRLEIPVYVAMIDLDGFKTINDTHGHEAGDAFLVAIAEVLDNGLREGDFVGRFGGDEFIALGPVMEEDVEASCQAIRQRLEELTQGRYDLGEDIVIEYGGASVGITWSRPGETTCQDILMRADVEMYKVKKERRQSTRPS